MSDHSVDDIRAHVKIYMMVFGALAVLTAVTVAVSYLNLSIGPAIALALLIATVKASLVALFFMHLKGSREWNHGKGFDAFGSCLRRAAGVAGR